MRSPDIKPKQFGRFLVVGVWNTIFGYLAFAGLNYLLTDRIPYAYMAAYVGANILAISMAYAGHKFLVFRTSGNYLKEYLRYFVVYGSSALLGLALLPIAVTLVTLAVKDVKLAPYIAQALLVGVNAVASFYAHLRFSFKKPG